MQTECGVDRFGFAPFGRTLMFVGKFAASRSHLKEGLALYDPNFHSSLVQYVGFDPNVNLQTYLGPVLLCLGFPDQALAMSSAAIAEARRLAHPPSLAGSLSLGAVLLSLDGNNAVLSEWIDQLFAVAAEQGFPHLGAQGTIYRGWAMVRNGDVAAGMSLIRRGSSAFCATEAQTLVPYHIALLAGACEIAGQAEEGLTLLDDALQIVERTGERWLESELYRHKGELVLRQANTDAAEELYRKALSIARDQEAKLWELRAAASLARLWRGQGRRAEAQALLAPIYGWFTKGFATPDLKEAKALLDELT